MFLTTCRQNGQCVRNLNIQLLIRHIAAINLVEHFSILDKKYTVRVTCRLGTVRYHKDRLSILIDLVKQLQQFTGCLRVKCSCG